MSWMWRHSAAPDPRASRVGETGRPLQLTERHVGEFGQDLLIKFLLGESRSASIGNPRLFGGLGCDERFVSFGACLRRLAGVASFSNGVLRSLAGCPRSCC